MNLIENIKEVANKCESAKTMLLIVVLSTIVGLCIAFSYASMVDDVPESASYSNNISIPAKAVFVNDFTDITIYVREKESNLTYGSGGIPLFPVTLNEAEFKAQEFSKYYYTIKQKDRDMFGDEMPAEVNLILFGINEKDIYQIFYTHDAGRIVAEKNSFGPWILDKMKPEYDVSGFEFKKTGEAISFISTLKHNSETTWWDAVSMGIVYGFFTWIVVFVIDVILFVTLKTGIFMAEWKMKTGILEE